MGKKMIDICVEIKGTTDKAFFVSDGGNSVWLPKSQIECSEDIEVGKTITITAPEWLVYDKGLI